MSTYETQRERELEALVKSFAAVDKANKARIALLEAVAEKASEYFGEILLQDSWDDEMQNALRAAGYLKDA